jgi:hypothetical protein
MEGMTNVSRAREVILWVVAVALMLATAYYQRRTGPSNPVRGQFEVAGVMYRYGLTRNAATSADARIAIPAPSTSIAGALHFKRYRTQDDFTTVPLRAVNGELVGQLPAQPAAGKVEYYLTLAGPDGPIRVPQAARGSVVLRFKDPVPLYVLVPHIALMFLSMVFGLRTGLAALFAPGRMRRLAWITLGGMSLGGMVLGPIAQKYAFGAYWTGFPYGYDLTDNKVLIMWLVWLAACAAIGFRAGARERLARWVVAIAALVVIVVYAIPHSAQGSELDWEEVDRGVAPEEAIKTGRKKN